MAELVQVFDHTGAPQDDQWTDDFFVNGSTSEGTYVAQNASRTVSIGAQNSLLPALYRCVAALRN